MLFVRSIISRLILILILALIPSLIVMSLNTWREFSEQKEQVRSQAALYAQLLALQQQKYVTLTESFLLGIAKLPAIKKPSRLICSDTVASLLKTNPIFVNVGIPLANGDLLCNALPLPTNRKINVSDRRYFRNTIDNEEFSMGEFQLDRAAGVSSINFSVPVYNDNKEVIAAAVAVVSLDWWSKQLAEFELPKQAVAFILDANGRVVASHYGSLVSTTMQKMSLILGDFSFDEEGVIEVISSDNVKRLVAHQPLFGSDSSYEAQVIIALPVEHAYSGAYQSLKTSMFIVLLSSAMLSMILYIGLKATILTPIYSLLDTTKKFVAAKLKPTIQKANMDELSVLADHFKQVILEQRKTEHALRKKEASLEQAYLRINNLLDNAPLGVIEWDPKLSVCRWSQACEQVFLLSSDRVMSKSIDAFPEPLKKELECVLNALLVVQSGKPYQHTLLSHHKTLEEEQTLSWRFSSICDANGDITAILSLFENVTEQIRYQEELEYQACYDTLTQLPNRYLLLKTLNDVLVSDHQPVAALLIALNDFKMLNDNFGHELGDSLLVTVADRLSHQVKESELLSRWGGDEFFYVFPYKSHEQVQKKAEAILELISDPIKVGDMNHSMQACVGIAISSDCEGDVEYLIKQADLSVFHTKRNKQLKISFFQSDMETLGRERFALESELRHALTQEQLLLHYQPIINLHSGKYELVEALIRWQHPTRGLVPPMEFIALAEETGLIIDIGRWVILEALKQLAEWQQEGGIGIKEVAVNVSPIQLKDAHLVALVQSGLEKYGLPPDCLTLEITESVLLDGGEVVFSRIEQYRRLGIKIALDDFGTGYSSLSYLSRIELDKIKIDRSFVNAIGSSKDEALINAIMTMAHSMNLPVVAEGIEDKGQLNFLTGHDCEYGQGYYFSRPLDAKALGFFIENAK
ncbi:EAL domain-containing protein [Vibrio sp. Of7-15]|uniref:bifunctional diguanylate cyclase/phosphodiesterase n=1 Tax=Vibrio sp. Of7-15 TaxID=2724879 RepID=UPI001EF19865|nr:EAL domain-containing protein [Vibrio sp. Of7-15]MCG7498450.1 EAL domain-containing protein [Vibrio sp. Of7-15]